jgi:hypothetical protein
VRRLLALLAAGCALAAAPAGAQERGRPGVPLRDAIAGSAPLSRPVDVALEQVLLASALRRIAADAGLSLVYDPELPQLQRRVSLHARGIAVGDALAALLRGSALDLLVSPAGTLILVPVRTAGLQPGRGAIHGTVRSDGRETGVAGALVRVVGTPLAAVSGPDGRFRVEELPPGRYGLAATRLGHAPARLDSVEVGSGGATEVVLTLGVAPVALSEVVVAPGTYGAVGEAGGTTQARSREQVRALPHVAADAFRAVERLVGVSSSDLSARFGVRGGSPDEVLVLLDGMELYRPFHLQEVYDLVSIVDLQNVGQVRLLTGGFPVEHGGRLGAVLDIRSTSPRRDSARGQAGLSLQESRLHGEGGFSSGRGGWLVSARRGHPGLWLLKQLNFEVQSADYADVFAKAEYQVASRHRVAAHLLGAADHLREQAAGYRSRHRSAYAWVTTTSALGGGSAVRTVLSLSSQWRRRNSSLFLLSAEDPSGQPTPVLRVADSRGFRIAALRQDWTHPLSPAYQLRWGIDLRNASAEYHYGLERHRVRLDEEGSVRLGPLSKAVRVDVAPAGTRASAYVLHRVRPWQALTVEAGLRYDWSGLTRQASWAPRASAALEVGPRTTLRAGWGLYHQPQGIEELQVSRGATRFARADGAEHRVAGVEHRAPGFATLRAEAYVRRHRPVAARHVDPALFPEIVPELFADEGVWLAPEGLTGRGVELFAEGDPDRALGWTVSYALAEARMRAEGRSLPSAFDERHSVRAEARYAPRPGWQVGAAWQARSGRPSTRTTVVLRAFADTTVELARSFGPLHGERLGAYHRLDIRVARSWNTRPGRIRTSLDVFNAYDASNLPDDSTGEEPPFISARPDYAVPRWFSVSVDWEF